MSQFDYQNLTLKQLPVSFSFSLSRSVCQLSILMHFDDDDDEDDGGEKVPKKTRGGGAGERIGGSID